MHDDDELQRIKLARDLSAARLKHAWLRLAEEAMHIRTSNPDSMVPLADLSSQVTHINDTAAAQLETIVQQLQTEREDK